MIREIKHKLIVLDSNNKTIHYMDPWDIKNTILLENGVIDELAQTIGLIKKSISYLVTPTASNIT